MRSFHFKRGARAPLPDQRTRTHCLVCTDIVGSLCGQVPARRLPHNPAADQIEGSMIPIASSSHPRRARHSFVIAAGRAHRVQSTVSSDVLSSHATVVNLFDGNFKLENAHSTALHGAKMTLFISCHDFYFGDFF